MNPITPEFLLLNGFKENNSQQFAKQTVWSRSVVRKNNKISLLIECLGTSKWVVLVGGLMLNVSGCQDVLDIISILEK